MFAIIQLFMDYDYVEGLEHVKSFPSYDEARAFISNEEAENTKVWTKYSTYVDDYINSIDVPEWTSYENWKEFCNKYGVEASRGRDNFKNSLRNKIIVGYTDFPNFSPPPRMTNRDLFIVEIKDKE